jgi:hypothetical protein
MTAMLQYTIYQLHVQKRGNTLDEYEDAFKYHPDTNGLTSMSSTVQLAIADGASESSFARLWAKLLVNAYRLRPVADTSEWRLQVGEQAARWQRYVSRRPLAWFAQEKASYGAFSTFLGLQVNANTLGMAAVGTWTSLAIGDSCLFQVRDGRLTEAFPIHSSAEFSNSVELVSSNLAKNSHSWELAKAQTGQWQVGDTFFLATDALSAWFLRECEAARSPWKTLLDLADAGRSQIQFGEWVERQRASGVLKNDDVTCLLLRL